MGWRDALRPPTNPPRHLPVLQVYDMVAANPSFFWWLLMNSSLAYAVNLTNFLVTKYTSALTMQVRRAARRGTSIAVLPASSQIGRAHV